MTPQGDAIGRPSVELDTPVLLMDLEKLERNLAQRISTRSDQWRG